MEGEAIEPIQQEIQVNFRYPVYFTTGVFGASNHLLQEAVSPPGAHLPSKVLAVVDRGVERHHPRLLKDLAAYCRHHQGRLALTGEPVLLEGGEGVKNNPEYVDRLHQAIHRAGLCRHSYLLAVGGGALIDLAGYAAATAHRGVKLIRVPTTVMAQLDAGIGVKNGVNAFGKKNFLGAFAPPAAVINDFSFLTTLSPRDWISGVAEAVKVALIKDAPFFAFIEDQASALARREMPVMQQVIHRCASLHLDHIAGGGDPFEFGSSRPLDFGHWAAHKLEALSGYALRHGEAVAIGVALDATYSYLAGLLPKKAWQRVMSTLTRLGLSLHAPELDAPHDLLKGLAEFREHLGGRLTIMLLWDIGQGLEVHHLDHNLILTSMALLGRIAGGPSKAARPVLMGLPRVRSERSG